MWLVEITQPLFLRPEALQQSQAVSDLMSAPGVRDEVGQKAGRDGTENFGREKSLEHGLQGRIGAA